MTDGFSRALAAMLVVAMAVPLARAQDAPAPAYDPSLADQYVAVPHADAAPSSPDARRQLARMLAFDATIYGASAVLEYRQLYGQAIDREMPGYVGFDRFVHGRDLATPDYAPFKSPNADTLYSNAYLDLRAGPVVLTVPPTGARYFTASLLDIFGNAANISTRTVGNGGGRFVIATTTWQGPVPQGTTLFRVATPLTWILLRVLVRSPTDLAAARAVQQGFTLQPTAPASIDPAIWPEGRDESAGGFLRILDFVVRTCGHPRGEDALVARFAALGVGTGSVAAALADPAVREGVAAGYSDAQVVIAQAIGQGARHRGSWSDNRELGRYGDNYLLRAATNTLGTGSNVIDENYPAVTFVDGDGQRLDGSHADYVLTLAPPPPARYFWSVTVYDARTRQLVPNPANKYLINDRTPGLITASDGAVTIRLRKLNKPTAASNLLPIPDGPFYVALRVQGPGEAVLSGAWQPPPIRREVARGGH